MTEWCRLKIFNYSFFKILLKGLKAVPALLSFFPGGRPFPLFRKVWHISQFFNLFFKITQYYHSIFQTLWSLSKLYHEDLYLKFSELTLNQFSFTHSYPPWILNIDIPIFYSFSHLVVYWLTIHWCNNMPLIISLSVFVVPNSSEIPFSFPPFCSYLDVVKFLC